VTADPRVVPSPLFGLRTWTVVGEPGAEGLAGPQRSMPWPAGGEWLEATCPDGHPAPAPGCQCGIHAWHPRRRWARRVMSTRQEIPGVVEATGEIEVHGDGFRAQRARPYALFLVRGRNRGRAERLGAAYGVPVIDAPNADAIVEWCRSRGLGLDEQVVAGLLGADGPEELQRARRRRTEKQALRMAGVAALVALLLAVGLILTDDPGDRTLYGRTGPVHQHDR
jgi:hypothetical protein